MKPLAEPAKKDVVAFFSTFFQDPDNEFSISVIGGWLGPNKPVRVLMAALAPAALLGKDRTINDLDTNDTLNDGRTVILTWKCNKLKSLKMGEPRSSPCELLPTSKHSTLTGILSAERFAASLICPDHFDRTPPSRC